LIFRIFLICNLFYWECQKILNHSNKNYYYLIWNELHCKIIIANSLSNLCCIMLSKLVNKLCVFVIRLQKESILSQQIIHLFYYLNFFSLYSKFEVRKILFTFHTHLYAIYLKLFLSMPFVNYYNIQYYSITVFYRLFHFVIIKFPYFFSNFGSFK